MSDLSMLFSQLTPSVAANAKGELVSREGGWEPVGYVPESAALVVASRKTGTLFEISSKAQTYQSVLLRFGYAVVNQYSAVSEEAGGAVFDGGVMTADMQYACYQLGPFDSSRVRGPGVYRDGNGLVVNNGKSVRTDKGAPVDVTPAQAGPVYVSGNQLGIDVSNKASPSEVDAFVQALQSFNFAKPGDHRLVAGWCVAATLAQALNYRPNLQLTADAACGKSTLLDLLGHVLGEQLITREGVPTKAQVLYSLEGRCAALAIDEFEAKSASARAFDAISELARVGFAGLRDDERITRVINGQVRVFSAPAGVLMAGITPPVLSPATESRTVFVTMRPRKGEHAAGFVPGRRSWLLDPVRAEDVRALGQRLRSLMVSRWSVLRASYDALVERLGEIGHDDRTAGKFATLLAGWFALTAKRAPKREELDALLAEHELLAVDTATEPPTALACVEHLLQSRIIIVRRGESGLRREVMSVREVVARVVDPGCAERDALNRQLCAFGLKVDAKRTRPGSPVLAVCSSPETPRLAAMFAASSWSNGGWARALDQLPGSERGNCRMSATWQPRVVFIKLPAEWLRFEEVPADWMI